MFARIVAALFILVADASAQYLLRPEDAAKVSSAMDESPAGGRKLTCEATHVKPFLDFAFRFESGFAVRCPVKVFEGKAVHLVLYARVTPASGKPVVLGLDFTTPAMPADMRPRTNLRHVTANFDFSGAFTLGEGEYTVDLLAVDSMNRFLQTRWKLKAARARGEELVPLTIEPQHAGQLSSRPWEGKLVKPGQGVRVTVLLDAAPRDPNSIQLRAWDRSFLMDSVSSVLRQIPCESVRLVAFNLEQQREIFRDEQFDRTGFRRLGRALRELELGTISYSVLKRQRGWAELLTNLTNQEVQSEAPSDLVIFLGPVTRLHEKIPLADLQPAMGNRPRFFDFEYFPIWLGGSEFPDSIHHLTMARNGTVLKIHSPGELARGIQRMLEQIPARD